MYQSLQSLQASRGSARLQITTFPCGLTLLSICRRPREGRAGARLAHRVSEVLPGEPPPRAASSAGVGVRLRTFLAERMCGSDRQVAVPEARQDSGLEVQDPGQMESLWLFADPDGG